MNPSENIDESIKQELISKYLNKKHLQYDYYGSKMQETKFKTSTLESENSENFERFDCKMTESIKEFLITSFSNHFIGSERTRQEIEKIVSNMYCVKVQKDKFLFKEGSKPSNFYIIEEGIFENSKKKTKIATLEKGGIIGSRSAIYDLFRQSNYIAKTDSVLWAIEISVYKKLIAEFLETKYEEYRKFLEKVELFSDLTPSQKNDLVYYVLYNAFKKGDLLMKEGVADKEKKISIFIVKSGKIAIYIKDKLNRILEEGDCFGENSLLHSKRTYTAIAHTDNVECFTISQDIMDTILGENIQDVIIKNIKRNCFRHSKYLRHLAPLLIEKIMAEMTEECYPQGIKVVEKDEQVEKLFLIIKGNLITNDGNKFPEGNAFLEECLMKNNYNNPYENVLTDSIGLLSEIEKKRFEEIIGGTLENYIKNNKNKDEIEFYEQFQSAMADKNLLLMKEELKKNEIKIIKEIGEGLSGIILLVSYKNKLFGLKIISKGWIIENNLEKYLINEKKICENINFSLITKLNLTFKDDISIYFMTEYIRGVELYDLLRTLGLFKISEARYYVSSLLLAIHYLHMKGIVHRDIKPENIMIDEHGYIKLLHLASAKILSPAKFKSNKSSILEQDLQNSSFKEEKTYTMVGSPHYCAPEMVLQKGYGFAVDYWSLGVCLFEFICGYVPFGEDSEDPMSVYKLIIKNKVEFPDYIKDKNGKRLIRQLLSKSPEARTKGSFHTIQSDIWFQSINWEDLLLRKIKPPFIPSQDSLLKQIDIDKLINKGITLERLTEDPSLDGIKEITNNMKVNYKNWDEIF